MRLGRGNGRKIETSARFPHPFKADFLFLFPIPFFLSLFSPFLFKVFLSHFYRVVSRVSFS